MKTTCLIIGLTALLIATGARATAATGAVQSPCDRVASSDRRDSSNRAALTSAQQLVDALQAGETGCLHGTFDEDVTVRRGGRPGAPIVVRSIPGERAVLRGRLWIADSADDVVFTGLRLEGRPGDLLPSPTVNGDRVTFTDNDVSNRNTTICFILGSTEGWGVAHDTRIEGNRIHNCGELPATNHHHAIYVENARDARIVGNWIYDNADRGVQLYPNAQGTLVAWNVIVQNGQGILFSGTDGLASSRTQVVGNVIAGSRVRHNVESWYPDGNPVGAENFVERNCLWTDGRPNVAHQVGFAARANVVARPQFLAPGRGDYRLRGGGPCSQMGPPRLTFGLHPAIVETVGDADAARRTLAAAPQAPASAAARGAIKVDRALAVTLLDRINALRAAHGLPALRASRPLNRAAIAHARSMGTHGFFSHNSRGGGSPFARIRRFHPHAGATVGENLLWATSDLTAERALQMWLTSPPHRRVLLTAAFRGLGTGAVRVDSAPGVFGGLDVVVVVTDFASNAR